MSGTMRALPWLLAALVVSGAGCRKREPPTAPRDVDPARLRASEATGAPRPLEGFGTDEEGSEGELLGHGWRFQGEPPLRLAPPIAWRDGERERPSWSFALNAWAPVSALLRDHARSGDRAELAAALALAMDWIASNPRTDAPPAGSFQWYDLAVGRRAYVLAYLIDVVRRDPATPDATLATLWRAFADHLDWLAIDANIAFHSNHGFFQVAEQLAAARRFGWLPGMPAIADQARGRLERMARQQFAPDGVHREHSPGYHWLLLEDWWTLVEAGLVDSTGIGEMTARLENALAWMIQPDGTLAMLGDTNRVDVRAQLAGRQVRSPALRHAVSGGRDGSAPAGEVAAFRDSGFVAMRQWSAGAGGGYLAAQCAFHSRTHKHADDLAIVWSDRGRPILIGPGVYGFRGKTAKGSALFEAGFWYSDPRRIYVESTAAHNTLELDGQSQDRKARAPYGSAIVDTGSRGAMQWAVCETTQLGGVVVRRVVVTSFGRWLVVLDVIDDPSDRAHRARQWFHFDPALAVDAASGAPMITGGPDPLRAASVLPGATWGAPIRGQDEPLQGWWSPRSGAFEPATAIALEHPPAAHIALASVFAFATTLEPDVEHSRVTADAADLRWRQDGETISIRVEGLRSSDPAVR